MSSIDKFQVGGLINISQQLTLSDVESCNTPTPTPSSKLRPGIPTATLKEDGGVIAENVIGAWTNDKANTVEIGNIVVPPGGSWIFAHYNPTTTGGRGHGHGVWKMVIISETMRHKAGGDGHNFTPSVWGGYIFCKVEYPATAERAVELNGLSKADLWKEVNNGGGIKVAYDLTNIQWNTPNLGKQCHGKCFYNGKGAEGMGDDGEFNVTSIDECKKKCIIFSGTNPELPECKGFDYNKNTESNEKNCFLKKEKCNTKESQSNDNYLNSNTILACDCIPKGKVCTGKIDCCPGSDCVWSNEDQMAFCVSD